MIKKTEVIDYTSKYEPVERSKWGIGSASRYTFTQKKDSDQKVFIKEYDSPTYPTPKDTEKTRKRLLENCKMFESHRISIINAINSVTSKYKPTAKTAHGNIINSIDFFRDNNTHRYMEVVPFVENINRSSLVVDLKSEQRIDIMKTSIFALSQVHSKGVIHSDLKPERKKSDGSIIEGNIILVKVPFSGKYTAKLIDFDSSYFEGFDNNNKYAYEHCVKGTSGYMSPELIDFKDYLDYNEEINKALATRLTTKSDIFSMGVIFHEYLTGHWPKTVGNVTVGHALLSDKEFSLDESIPESLRNLIRRMLMKDYNDRPSAIEVFEALKGHPAITDEDSWEECWPADNIVLNKKLVIKMGERIRKGKKSGQYRLGEGFNVVVKTAAELVDMGLASRISKAKSDSGISKGDEVPNASKDSEEDKIEICEPWAEDNITFIAKKLTEKGKTIAIKRSKRKGQYLFGSGFTATVKTASELISLGYAKKKG